MEQLKLILSLLFILLLIQVVSCTVAEDTHPTSVIMPTEHTFTKTNATVDIVTPTKAIPTSSLTIATITPTMLPATTLRPTQKSLAATTVTETLTLTVTITPTQVVIFDKNKFLARYEACELPCFWGIEIGENIDTVVTELNVFTPRVSVIDRYSGENRGIIAKFRDTGIETGLITPDLTVFFQEYMFEEDILVEIKADVSAIKPLHPLGIVAKYGVPDELWISTRNYSYTRFPDLQNTHTRLKMYYPNIGLLVSSELNSLRIDDTIEICFEKQRYTVILTWDTDYWDPNREKTIIERAESSTGGASRMGSEVPIAGLSNYDPDKFLNAAQQGQSYCIKTPMELWPEFDGTG